MEGSITWAIQKVRRNGGARAGGYPGAATIDTVDGEGATRVGLISTERMPVREGASLVDANGADIGVVTSGPSPSLGQPVALASVATAQAALGTQVFAIVRDKRVASDCDRAPPSCPTAITAADLHHG